MSRRGSLLVWAITLTVLVAGYFAYDWRFWLRHLQSPPDSRIVFDFDWYTPIERLGEGDGRAMPAAAPEARTIDAAAVDQVLAYAKEMDSYAVIISHRGQIQAEYYKDGFNAGSMFDTGSMHKGLLSIAFGVAVDRGLIPSIDMPASTYLTEWANDSRKAITIRHLLANTSGLAEPQFSEVPWSAAYRLFIGTDIDRMVIGLPLIAEPGTKFSFNHVNAQLLHAVLTRATGMTYANFLKQYFWQPLGNGAGQVRLDEPNGNARTVCCFQTTARSWLRVAQMVMDGGKVGDTQVVSPAWISAMTAPTDISPKFGFNMYIAQPDPPRRRGGTDRVQPTVATEPFAATDVRYLEGRGGQRTLWIPSQDLIVIRIGRINFGWDDAKVINPLIAGLKAQ